LQFADKSPIPAEAFLFFLLNNKNEAIYVELHKSELDVQKLKNLSKQKGMGYLITQGGNTIDIYTVRKDARQMVANPNARAPLDMSYGSDGQMAKSQLKSIARIATQLQNVLQNNDRLPQWVHTKIATSLDRLTTAHNYLMSKINSMNQMQSNPSYITNGKKMCVIAWTSSILMSHPMTLDEIQKRAKGVCDVGLLQVAIEDLLNAGEIVQLNNGRYFDADFARDQKLA